MIHFSNFRKHVNVGKKKCSVETHHFIVLSRISLRDLLAYGGELTLTISFISFSVLRQCSKRAVTPSNPLHAFQSTGRKKWLRAAAAVGEATVCDFSIPYGRQFTSWLLHFRSVYLLTCLGKVGKEIQAIRPCHSCVRESDDAPDSWLLPGPTLPIEAIWEVNHWLKDLSFQLSL